MRVIFLLLLIYAGTRAVAQGTIQGKLVDSAARTPLSLATVTVFKEKDTSLVTYRLSNAEGVFKVTGLPLHTPLLVVISYSGYEAFRKSFSLENEMAVNMDTIGLAPSSKSLDEVLVIAERPPVMVRNDTIEFNASSFKTLPTSLVEDLLKKLPGVEVDREGNIMANGRNVNRILVDGKSFFGNDPKMATKNLPANIIDKIQLTDDKDELARKTDDNLTNVGQVINLTLKKGVKKGWFGKIYAGAGNNNRYEAGGIANIFRDTLQLSLLAFSNNVNRSGFSMSDVQSMGGFDRSGYNSMMIRSSGGQTGFEINGISFGGLDAGVSKTTGAGFNLNHAPNQNKSFFLQYFYGKNENNMVRKNNTLQFLNDTTVNTLTHTNSRRNANKHNLGAGYNVRPDSVTRINFDISYVYSGNNNNSASTIAVTNNKAGNVSTGAGNQFITSGSKEYNHSFYITRNSRSKKSRSINFDHSLNYTSNLNQHISETAYEYFYPLLSEQELDQLRNQNYPVLNIRTGVSLSEPLSKNIVLRWRTNHSYIKEKQSLAVYGKDGVNDTYNRYFPEQSSGFDRRQNNFSSRLSLAIKLKQLTITPGVTADWLGVRSAFQNVGGTFRQNLFNLLPALSLNWKQVSVQYSQSVSLPSVQYLTPVADSTNPFYIVYGNPNLQPLKSHNLYINNFNYFAASGVNFNVYVNGSINNKDVVMKRTVQPNGVQTVVPVNADGSVYFQSGVSFGKQFKKNPKFIYSFRLSPFISIDKKKLIVNEIASTATNVRFSPRITLGFNWNDIIELNPAYSFSISRTAYSDAFFNNIKTVIHTADGELIVRWPKKLVWETNLLYSYTNQAAPGLPRENVLWNAAVTLLMLKGDVGMLKFTVFDILNRNTGLSRFTRENQIIDEQTNVLHRFAELSFTYNIRNMGAKKVGGKERLLLF